MLSTATSAQSIRRLPVKPLKVARRSSNSSSALSNGARKLFADGRSAGARRYRDLCHGFAEEAGDKFDALPESTQQIIRRVAQLCVEIEIQEARRAVGGDIDVSAYVTSVNSFRRLVADLKHATGKPVRYRYLARRRAGTVVGQADPTGCGGQISRDTRANQS